MNHEGGKAEESGDIPTCVDYDFLEGEDNYTEVSIPAIVPTRILKETSRQFVDFPIWKYIN